MSLLIRYTHIPFYFCFSFTFPTSPIHHYAPPLQRDRMRSHDNHTCLFDGHMIYDSHVFTSILSISNVPPPVVGPIMSSRTARSGTFYNFALCSLSCFPFVFNLPVFTSCSEHHQRRATQLPIPVSPELRFSTYTSHHLPLILHYFALHCTAMIPPSLLATTHLETIPYPHIAPPQSPIGFILRSLAP